MSIVARLSHRSETPVVVQALLAAALVAASCPSLGAGPRVRRGHARPALVIGRNGKDPPMSVPAIARILGVRVGYNGQDALQHQFGKGLATLGGHPDGRKTWLTRKPLGYITTDGFNHNPEGLALESLSWGLDPPMDKKIPYVRALPRGAGWLGSIVPGMSRQQVAALTSRMPTKPILKPGRWIWREKGFVRPASTEYVVYTNWTAQLTFDKDVLTTIDVECRGGYAVH